MLFRSLQLSAALPKTTTLCQERVDWHNVVVFGKAAESCKEYLKKGREVYIEGRLRIREYEAKDNGGKRQRAEIIANRVQFLGARPASTTAARTEGGCERPCRAQPRIEPTSASRGPSRLSASVSRQKAFEAAIPPCTKRKIQSTRASGISKDGRRS